MDAPVEIVVYDPLWPEMFEAERVRLAPLLAGVEIHHIGSTAVPGLAAKPVIDLMALVDELDEPIPRLTAVAGYQYPEDFNAGLVHRRWLCHPSRERRVHHLHLVDDAAELDRHLLFRDRLRADPDLGAAYADLKRELARRFREDREGYAEAKTEFILGAVSATPS